MENLLAAAVIIVSVLVVYLQAQKAYRATIATQEDHLRNELKLRLYERVSAVFATANEKVGEALSAHAGAMSTFRLRQKGFDLPFRDTLLELSEKAHAAGYAIVRVMTTLEEYEIVFVRFGAFRRQLGDSHGELLDAQMNVFDKLAYYLPNVDEKGRPLPALSTPTDEQLRELESLHKRFNDALGDVSGYMLDLQIETQNELLGNLFTRQLPPRNPGDPAVKVIGRDPEEQKERPRGRVV